MHCQKTYLDPVPKAVITIKFDDIECALLSVFVFFLVFQTLAGMTCGVLTKLPLLVLAGTAGTPVAHSLLADAKAARNKAASLTGVVDAFPELDALAIAPLRPLLYETTLSLRAMRATNKLLRKAVQQHAPAIDDLVKCRRDVASWHRQAVRELDALRNRAVMQLAQRSTALGRSDPLPAYSDSQTVAAASSMAQVA